MRITLRGHAPERHLSVAILTPVPDAIWIHQGHSSVCIPVESLREFIVALTLAEQGTE